MNISIRRNLTSQPLVFTGVTNAYEKGSFYCMYWKDTNKVKKIPLSSIFDIDEEYNPTEETKSE